MACTRPEVESQNRRPTIVLCDQGDAILLIGPENDQQPVLVSRIVMSLASSVWKAMFCREQWTESTATELSLPEDNVDAMLIALRIAHLKFKDLPSENELSFEAFLDLAVLCDKYDLIQLVRPFVDLHGWAKEHLKSVAMGINYSASWLFICWTFGYEESFASLANKLVKRVQLNSEGVATINGNEEFPEHMPPGLLGEFFSCCRPE